MNTDKALAVLPFVGVVNRDKDGKPTTIQTPACTRFTDGKRGAPRFALVQLDRSAAGAVRCTCTHYHGDGDEGEACPAASGPTVCYHVLAAVMATGADAGAFVNWYTDEQAARTAQHGGGGWLLRVQSGPRAEAWAVLVMRKKQASKPATTAPAASKPTPPAPVPPAPEPATVEPLALTLFPLDDGNLPDGGNATASKPKRRTAKK